VRRRLAQLILPLCLLGAACGGGKAGDTATTTPTTGPTPRTDASATTEATVTTVPLTAPAAGTLPQPVGPNPPVGSVSAGPGTTITTLTGGDASVFCPNLELSFPGSFVISLGGDDDPAGAAIAEVAMAPVLAGPLDAIARSAPRELVGPFVLWDDRNRQALAAFQQIGAPADKVTKYVADLQAELGRLQDGSSSGAIFDDLPATAARYGIDRSKLVALGRSFGSSYGSFDDFFDQLSLDITLAPDVEASLEQRFPCAADLANPDG
jgi:hypothetical protein